MVRVVMAGGASSEEETLQTRKRFCVRQTGYACHENREVFVQADIQGAFFVKEGHSSATVRLEKDALQPKGTLNIAVALDNSKCAKDIEKVTANLIRHVESKEGSWAYHNDKVLQTYSFTDIPAFTFRDLLFSFPLD
jgi:hypothetical protein